jgi:hypothetical protein
MYENENNKNLKTSSFDNIKNSALLGAGLTATF